MHLRRVSLLTAGSRLLLGLLTLMLALVTGGLLTGLAGPADAHLGGGGGGGSHHGGGHGWGDRACPPSAVALGYSDGLDKAVVDGVTVGGLSDIAWDARSHAYASTVDNHLTDPSRIWHWSESGGQAHIVGGPLVLRAADGTPYTGATADNEGLAVLPDGDYLVSSETEPSIRVFGRDGVQVGQLPVPQRFLVAPAGEATANATLEGLTVTPDGRQVVASMEGTLSGDVGSDGTDTYRRFLVYDATPAGWQLTRELGYQVQPGNRIAEVQAYGRDGLLVLEAAYSSTAGNTIQLYAVHTRHAADVTDVPDLADAPADVMAKTEVADVTACPSLGAPAKETQTNPLMDNYEGLTIAPLGRGWHRHHRLSAGHSWGHGGGHGWGHRGELARVTLISDDNFSDLQTTRVLDLGARLP